MYNIAVIGAGNLGSRHLQGLTLINIPINIHVVDPSEKSLSSALQRVKDRKDNSHILSIVPHQTFITLPKNIDLAIIATTANTRLEALQSLCAAAKVKNIILEKVLFQKVSDFEIAQELLLKHQVHCWVNCPMRMYPIYNDLKKIFANESVKHLDVYGGNWGLGCNSIHYLDLLAYFNGLQQFSFNPSLLEKELSPSKRQGFIEFTGTLVGKMGNATFSLTSLNNDMKYIITLRTETKSVLIDETMGALCILDDNKNDIIKFTLPYQSQLTNLIAESILLRNMCNLTSYEHSMQIHIPFLKTLAVHSTNCADALICEIT